MTAPVPEPGVGDPDITADPENDPYPGPEPEQPVTP